jgi:hypothetical protein
MGGANRRELAITIHYYAYLVVRGRNPRDRISVSFFIGNAGQMRRERERERDNQNREEAESLALFRMPIHSVVHFVI